MRDEIGLFLSDKLKLSFHPKKVIIQNVKDGLPFVGYLIFYDHIKIRGKITDKTKSKKKEK